MKRKSIQLNIDAPNISDEELRSFLAEGLSYLSQKARHKGASHALGLLADAAAHAQVHTYDSEYGEPVFYVP